MNPLIHLQDADNAERALLGAILIDPACFPTCREYIITAECFNTELNQEVWLEMDRCYRRHGQIDTMALFEALMASEALGSGGASYLGGLTAATPTSANAELYAQLVLEAHQMRELARNAGYLAEDAKKGVIPIDELREQAAAMVQQISNRIERERIQTSAELADATLAEIEHAIAHGGITGVKTGFSEYDRRTGGLAAGMHVVGARPSVGKTAFGVNVAHNVAVRDNNRVLFVSLEMSPVALQKRMVYVAGRIRIDRLYGGFLSQPERDKLRPAIEKVKAAPVEFMQSGGLKPSGLRKILQRYTDSNPLSLVVIDYLQLMRGDEKADNRNTEVADITRNLKLITTEFNVPLLVLAQVNRDADGNTPKLSNLRESGTIEQDADTVLFLHPDKDTGKLYGIVAKQREGETGGFEIYFDKPTQFMGNAGGEPQAPPPQPHSENYYGEDDDDTPF